jgi:hypothetical protein
MVADCLQVRSSTGERRRQGGGGRRSRGGGGARLQLFGGCMQCQLGIIGHACCRPLATVYRCLRLPAGQEWERRGVRLCKGWGGAENHSRVYEAQTGYSHHSGCCGRSEIACRWVGSAGSGGLEGGMLQAPEPAQGREEGATRFMFCLRWTPVANCAPDHPNMYEPVPGYKRKLERGHFSQSHCISAERPGRRLIEVRVLFSTERGLSPSTPPVCTILSPRPYPPLPSGIPASPPHLRPVAVAPSRRRRATRS